MPAPVAAVWAAKKAARKVVVRAASDRRVQWAAVGVAVCGGLAVMMVAATFLTYVSIIPPPDVTGTTRPTVAAVGTVLNIPPVAYAALVQASAASERTAGCFVRVGLLGGVMGIESGYGTFGGSAPDPATGLVTPPIFGPALDGRPGFELIYNDAYGQSLGVTGPYAKAVGPTQFLPSTWRVLGRDGDGDGTADPQNIFDAAMSTAAYLCAHGYVEGDTAAVSKAILAYNFSFTYLALVLERAAQVDAAVAAKGAPGPQPGLTVVGGITVASDIAGPLQDLLAAAQADGIVFGGYGWRSYQTQVDLRRAHCGTSDYAVYEMDSGSCNPPTARPGHSNHETGHAIDFFADGATLTSGSRGFRWLAANAARFGFYNLASEPWHFSVDGK